MTSEEIKEMIRKEVSEAFIPNLNLISIQSASIALDISKMTIYRMIKDGRLTLLKVGKRSYLKVDEINQLGLV